MRIERHRVSRRRLEEAMADFEARVGRRVRRADRSEVTWEEIGDALFDYAGARSAVVPRIDRDAHAALVSAAETHLGATMLATFPEDMPVRVGISYIDYGMSYGPGEDGRSPAGPGESLWLRTLYLCVIAGRDQEPEVAEPLLMAGETLRGGTAPALTTYLYGPAGLAGEPPEEESLPPALYALVTGDEDRFWAEMAEMLVEHRRAAGEHAAPRTLLPVEPIALTAMAVRREGWRQRIESDYLPEALTGTASPMDDDPAAFSRARDALLHGPTEYSPVETKVIALSTDIDVSTAPELRERLLENIGGKDGPPMNLVLDLSGVGFIDQTGWGVLAGMALRLEDRGGKVHLAAAREKIKGVHRFLGEAAMKMPLYDTVDEAVAATR